MVSTLDAIAADLALLLDGVAAVTFDLDGTLADTGPPRLGMWPGLLRNPRVLLGWPAAMDAQRGARMPDPRAAAVAELAARIGAPPDRVDRVIAREIDTRWPALYRHAPVPPGVGALLAEVRRRGLPVAIVSDYPGLAKLEAMGLEAARVIDCRALGGLKPFPDGLLAAAAQLGVRPDHLLHVGDRPDTDGRAAAACGARFALVDELRHMGPADPPRRLL